MTRPGIEPRSPGPLLNTLFIRLIGHIYTSNILTSVEIIMYVHKVRHYYIGHIYTSWENIGIYKYEI